MSDQERLFEGGTEIGPGDNSEVEMLHRPTGMTKERPPTVVFSCDNAEERERLVEVLGLHVNRSTVVWTGSWPEADELRLDV